MLAHREEIHAIPVMYSHPSLVAKQEMAKTEVKSTGHTAIRMANSRVEDCFHRLGEALVGLVDRVKLTAACRLSETIAEAAAVEAGEECMRPLGRSATDTEFVKNIIKSTLGNDITPEFMKIFREYVLAANHLEKLQTNALDAIAAVDKLDKQHREHAPLSSSKHFWLEHYLSGSIRNTDNESIDTAALDEMVSLMDLPDAFASTMHDIVRGREEVGNKQDHRRPMTAERCHFRINWIKFIMKIHRLIPEHLNTELRLMADIPDGTETDTILETLKFAMRADKLRPDRNQWLMNFLSNNYLGDAFTAVEEFNNTVRTR